jgi:hypothetical protein
MHIACMNVYLVLTPALQGSEHIYTAQIRQDFKDGVPKGIRTPVAAVKGQCPRPLDDGDYATTIT